MITANAFILLLGLIGNIGFGVACIPMTWRTWQSGKNEGIPLSSAWTFLIAIVSFYGYLLATYPWNPLTNIIGIVEALSWMIVLWYSYFPRQPTVIEVIRCPHGFKDWDWCPECCH